jgi:putative endonuclease
MIFWRKKNNQGLGAKGESLAADYLKKKGYRIIQRNYKNKIGRQIGEIDIIAEKGNEIVFVEVKTRELSKYYGTLPEENITQSKIHKLEKIATSYIKLNNYWNRDYHFDAISVWLSDDYDEFKIKHIESIFI